MVLVNCDNPVIIRNDRVYRYVGNPSDVALPPNDSTQDVNDLQDMDKSDVDPTYQQNLNTESISKVIMHCIQVI